MLLLVPSADKAFNSAYKTPSESENVAAFPASLQVSAALVCELPLVGMYDVA